MNALVCVSIAVALALELLACAGTMVAASPHDRLHFLAPASLAALFFALAILIEEGPSLIALKGGLTATLLFIGSPLSAHAIARAATLADGSAPIGEPDEEQA